MGLTRISIFILGFIATVGAASAEIDFSAHPYRSLGDDFSAEISVRHDAEAELAFFNFELANRLGIPYPSDPAALTAWAKKNFAWQTSGDFGFQPLTKAEAWERNEAWMKQKKYQDSAREMADRYLYQAIQDKIEFESLLERAKSAYGDRTFMATYYLDAHQKIPGSAIGDGRTLYLGICPGCGEGGVDLDVQLKGSGVNPMAWTSNPGHHDGKLAELEAAHSLAMSQALRQIGLDITEDLMIFRKRNGKALSVRIGNHFRPAHLAYFADDGDGESELEKLRKFSIWIINRGLRRPDAARVTLTELTKYLDFVAEKVGKNCAIMEAWNVVHTSPTRGNFTLDGGMIDAGSLRVLNTARGEFEYGPGFGQEMPWRDQTHHIFSVFADAMDHLANGIMRGGRHDLAAYFRRQFSKSYQKRLWTEVAKRIGFTAEQADKVRSVDRKELVKDYRELMNHKHVDRNVFLSRAIIALADERFVASRVDLDGLMVGRKSASESRRQTQVILLRMLKSLRSAAQSAGMNADDCREAARMSDGLVKLEGKSDIDYARYNEQIEKFLGEQRKVPLANRSAGLLNLFYQNGQRCELIFAQ